MAKKITKKRKGTRSEKPVPTNCPFCKEKREPDYKRYSELAKYLTDRAKINPKVKTGLCAKHQRRLATQIKRARQLGLLPYVVGP